MYHCVTLHTLSYRSLTNLWGIQATVSPPSPLTASRRLNVCFQDVKVTLGNPEYYVESLKTYYVEILKRQLNERIQNDYVRHGSLSGTLTQTAFLF